MPVIDEIEARLRAAFAPDQLEVVNESHRHAGHAGDDGTGETHFAVRIRAAPFAGMSRIARHRAVLAALVDIPGRVHALALDIG
ncbi:BolA family transcriptional regulator [Xinfangfangia sp. D13-10-4-6]|uniref:BolA family protein n=1 Tax=Pseudogemmobacter hezensis TaxID=2737662 RepID=UPI0015572183|nr:BolA family protein [Pseudogemmobacter hezensis]NPD17555.1 BolA family transcriptional regulator [Pseudogemmobacter hezensis]